MTSFASVLELNEAGPPQVRLELANLPGHPSLTLLFANGSSLLQGSIPESLSKAFGRGRALESGGVQEGIMQTAQTCAVVRPGGT